jgi:hypothetical protein
MATLWRDDRLVQDTLGRAVSNASVYWVSQPATTNVVPPSPLIAVATSANGVTSVANNPQITNGFGQASAYMVAGIYTIVEVWNGRIQQVYPDQAIGVSSQSGTVSSVALTAPSDVFSVGGSPITTGGTLSLTKTNVSAGLVAAGPASGSATPWTFRSLAVSDLPAQGGATVVSPGTTGKIAFNASITSGTAILTIPTAGQSNDVFTSGDVGKSIWVSKAGAAGVPLFTTILSFQSSTQVTLAANAATTVTNRAVVAWFSSSQDDTSTVQGALQNATAASPRAVLSPGVYIYSNDMGVGASTYLTALVGNSTQRTWFIPHDSSVTSRSFTFTDPIADFEIGGFSIMGVGTGGNNPQGELRFDLSANSTVDRLNAHDMIINDVAGNSLWINTPILSTISRIRYNRAALDGIFAQNGTTTTFIDCYGTGVIQSAFHFEVMTTTQMYGCAFDSSGRGLYMHSCNTFSVDGLDIEAMSVTSFGNGDGIWISGGSGCHDFQNCYWSGTPTGATLPINCIGATNTNFSRFRVNAGTTTTTFVAQVDVNSSVVFEQCKFTMNQINGATSNFNFLVYPGREHPATTATMTFDASTGSAFETTLNQNVTIVLNNPQDAQIVTFIFQQDSTGGRTVAWPGNFVGAVPPSTAANAISLQTFFYDYNFAAWYPLNYKAAIAQGQRSFSTTSATLTIDASQGNLFEVTLTQNVTTLSFANGTSGQNIQIVWIQGGGGGFTVAFPSSIKGGTAPSGGAATRSVQNFVYDGNLPLWFATAAGVTGL